jgi:translation initiation factor eIF-2B subunit epsilon
MLDDWDQSAIGLGGQTNAFVWPRKVSDPEDAEVDELESFNNRRLMRLGQ